MGELESDASSEPAGEGAATELVVVGLSHRSAPIAVRERLAIPEGGVPQALDELAGLAPVGEVMVLSTCNRVEIFASSRETSAELAITAHLTARGGEVVRPHLYSRSGEAALVHLFRVAASLDSLVVGEPQILGQLKEAFEIASRHGAAQGKITRACQGAFVAAKRVRSETLVGAMPVSMASAAIELARKVFGTLAGRAVLVVGAGPMSELCARHLTQHGASLKIANRTLARAEALASSVGNGAQARPFEMLPQLLQESDVIISSTAAPRPLFTPELVATALKARKNRPLFLVDLAVPRDVDPRVHQLDHVFAYDVDDLDRVVGESLSARAEEAGKAEVIVLEEVASYLRSRANRLAVPLLAELRKRADEIARTEAEKTLAHVGGALDERQRRSVEAMAQAIVNKLLHEPTLRLRTAGAAGPEEAARVMQAAAELFGLEPPLDPPRRAETAGEAPATKLAQEGS